MYFAFTAQRPSRHLPVWSTRGIIGIIMVVGILLAAPATTVLAEDQLTGQQIYRKHCAGCHGVDGEGVSDVNETPLHGDRSLPDLIRVIDETMPEDKPAQCTGEAAEKVARYIYKTFYKMEARVKQKPPRVALARLTKRQYGNTVADLLATFMGTARIGDKRGLSGTYYSDRSFGGGKKVATRVDPQVVFSFGAQSPLPEIKDAKEFSIRWEGAVLAEDTGDYEFYVKTENGAKLYVNDNETPLIDAWVSSPGRMQDHSATIRLLGGRPYPVKLDVFKFKEKSASIALEWKPPHKARAVIPERNLSPERVPTTFVATAPFPPDDSVSGYERGTSISLAWDQAATQAAVEMAAYVAAHLDRLSNSKTGASDRAERSRQFCYRFTERAFRRPLTPPQRNFFVDAHFGASTDIETAVKRSVLLTLKSPRFLYPSAVAVPPDDYTVASRLALGLWDSLPDPPLLQAASRGQLRTPQQIASQAWRMLRDPRAGAKLRCFFHRWLQMDEKESLAKDKQRFPDFDAAVASDLRTSLDLFLEDVVCNEKSDYRQLLLADYMFLNARLCHFYGLQPPAEDGFHKVSLDQRQRAGVVTHPYLLATFAYPNSSSPIHRGVFVTRRLLGRSLKPPPQATEFKDADFDPSMTTREKVALVTKSMACQSCHTVINPLGFSLENFDAVGRYREQEQERPIDATADYTTAAGETVHLDGCRTLAGYIADSEQAQGAFVDQLFHYAVKQPINAYGPAARQDLIDAFAAADYNMQSLLVEIMKVSVLHGVSK